jgi:hypothetical protein
MHKELELLCTSLDNLAAAILSGWSGDQTFNEAWGWPCPTVTRHDMSAVASLLAKEIRASNIETVSPSEVTLIQDYPRRLSHMQATTIPNFWSGNAGVATSAYLITLNTLRQSLGPMLGWQILGDPKAMPAPMARKLSSIQAAVDLLMPNKELLTSQINEIQQAHAVAESLPLDLKALTEARDQVVKLAAESAISAGKAKDDSTKANSELDAIKLTQVQADKLVAQCEEAYRITTTTGLAGAFDQRAKSLSNSMWGWVVGLIATLIIGSYLGSTRLELLSKSMTSGDPHWGIIWMHVVLSIMSIGAPIWFAWISTKQIGQRFRLAEDYAFKASVAKAYEGYKKEAARIDPSFEARLFSSALTRLEEAPLRLVEKETHGSPGHEVFSSKQFQDALSTIPEHRDKFIEVFKNGLSAVTANLSISPKKTLETD